MTIEFKDNSKEFLDAMENAIKNGLTAAEHKYKTPLREKSSARSSFMSNF